MRYVEIIVFVLMGVMTSQSFGQTPPAGKLVSLEIETSLVPSPAKVDVLLPPGYEAGGEGGAGGERLPVVIWLHGGASKKSGTNFLAGRRRMFEAGWASGDLAPCVVVAPVTGTSYYIDWFDGTNQWDTFITGEMLTYVRANYHVKEGRAGTVIGGSSAGGKGTLRIALKHPERFIAAAAMAPGFVPTLEFSDWDIGFMGDEFNSDNAKRFGDPISEEFWRSTHPPTQVIDNVKKIRDSGLQLLIEAGDEDANDTYRGAELLHRLLYDAVIEHDYHLQRGAEHGGRSMAWRMPEVFRFLSRALRNVEALNAAMERRKRGEEPESRLGPRKVNELPMSPLKFKSLNPE